MGTFRFKQFEVVNDSSPMKVGTDGVLLGAAATLYPTDSHVLDVGTGTGVIALMLAQRLQALSECINITGIDIDAASAAEAGLNFARSPWANALEARHCALRDFVPAAPLDLVVSNPPYFQESLLPPELRRGLARHAAGSAFSFADLADFAATHLRRPSPIPSSSSAQHPECESSPSPIGGHLAVILPADQEVSARRYAASVGLSVFRILRIRTTPRKPVSRVILELTLVPFSAAPSESELTIMDAASYPDNKNGYTPDYLALTGDFYLQ